MLRSRWQGWGGATADSLRECQLEKQQQQQRRIQGSFTSFQDDGVKQAKAKAKAEGLPGGRPSVFRLMPGGGLTAV
jgi:hypothetical protein